MSFLFARWFSLIFLFLRLEGIVCSSHAKISKTGFLSSGSWQSKPGDETGHENRALSDSVTGAVGCTVLLSVDTRQGLQMERKGGTERQVKEDSGRPWGRKVWLRERSIAGDFPFFLFLVHNIRFDTQCCCSNVGPLSCLFSSLFILFMLPSFLPKTKTKLNISDRTISLTPFGSSLAYYHPSTIWMESLLFLTRFLIHRARQAPDAFRTGRLCSRRHLWFASPSATSSVLFSRSPGLFLPQSCCVECSLPWRLSL